MKYIERYIEPSTRYFEDVKMKQKQYTNPVNSILINSDYGSPSMFRSELGTNISQASSPLPNQNQSRSVRQLGKKIKTDSAVHQKEKTLNKNQQNFFSASNIVGHDYNQNLQYEM